MKKFLSTGILALLLFAQTHADLVISEVYFDSTDEWIEVYNDWSESYSWSIVLSWAKASTVTIPNMSISPTQAIIVWDNMSMITNSGIIARSWLSLNFPDTQAINVRIISGSDTISIFTVDTGTVAAAKLTNASIHKNLGDNNTYIAQEPYIANSTVGHPSNPGVVYTWFAWVQTPELIISEVYFEWADERFEITNKGLEDFIGDITIQWLSNLPLTMSVSISSQNSIVIADTISSFVDASKVLVPTENIVIPDDGNIEAILSYQSQTIDTFDVAENLVAPYVDSQNSFEKVRYNSQLQITVATGDRIFNVPAGIIANPWMIFTVYDQVIDIGDWQNQGWWGWTPPTYCTTLGSEIQISEVFFGSGNYQPYIELYIPAAFDQNITLSGSLLDNPVTFSVTEEAGDYFLVSMDTNGLIDNNSLHDNQELSLRWELWYLEVYGQNGQVLDIVDIRTLGNQNGVVFSSLGDCQRVFESTFTMSPGFDHNLFQYKSSQTVVHWWWGGGWGSSCPSTDEFPVEENQQAILSGIDIVDIIYDPFGSDTDRETITLHSLFTTDFDLRNIRMAVSTRSWTQSLSGILYAGQIQTFTGNYRFPNTSACVSLLTGSNIFDIYCYPSTDNAIYTGTTQMSWVAIPSFTGYFDITHIIYDPDGNDTNNETISFVASGIQITEDSKLIIWSRNFVLDDYVWLYSGDTTLTGNFRFPNSIATCVFRSQGIDIIDTYCYDPFATDIQTPPDIRIRSIVYDPPWADTNTEQISLELLTPKSVDLSTLRLRIGTRNAMIKWILTSGSIQTFTDNFRFPNTDACVSLMFEDMIVDTLCYQADESNANDSTQDVDIGIDYTNTSIDITDIVYDPAWDDTNNEELHLVVWSDTIDLADDFYLTINNTKRYLTSFGTVQGDEILIGNFRFPNTKDTCVSIHRQDRIFDTYCYTPQQTHMTGDQEIQAPDYDIQIVNLIPNPDGKDENSESITLLLSWVLPVDVSQWFDLRINKTKKKISGVLIPWQEQIIVGNFRFPNTASCVTLEKSWFIFDRFCYEKPDEGDIFTSSKWVLKSISTVDLSILQKSQLTRFGSKLCITYEGASIKCKNAPLKVSPTNELKLYKSYIWVLHDYLMWDRNILFYNSPLKLYKTIFDTAKEELKQFKSFVMIEDTRVPVYDIPQRFALQYQQAFVDSFADSVLSQILWDKWQSQLSVFRDQRFASLMEDT